MTPLDFIRRHAIDMRPLRHVAYRRLYIGLAVSTFGLQFTAVAVPVQMFHLTGSSLWVGLLGIAALVPLVFFALWGGAVADVVDRRWLLLGASLLMWASTLTLFVLTATGAVSRMLLLVLTASQAMGWAVSAPTRGAIVPRLIEREEISSANALNTTTFNMSMTIGPLVAGLLVQDGHYAAAYAVDAIAFTVVLWAAFRLPTLRPLPVAEAELTQAVAADGLSTPVSVSGSGSRPGSGSGLAAAPHRALVRPDLVQSKARAVAAPAGWAEVRASLAYIAGTPVLWLSFAIDIAAMVFALPRALFPEVADERFGADSIGWLYAAISIGSVLAGLTSGWIARVRAQGRALVVAVVLWGLAVAAAGLAPTLWLAVLLLALGGAADLVSSVYRQTILQTYAPDGFQGRLQGVFFAVVAGGPRLGDLRAGVSAALVGSTVAWVGGGIAAAVVAAVLALAFPALLRYTPPARTR